MTRRHRLSWSIFTTNTRLVLPSSKRISSSRLSTTPLAARIKISSTRALSTRFQLHNWEDQPLLTSCHSQTWSQTRSMQMIRRDSSRSSKATKITLKACWRYELSYWVSATTQVLKPRRSRSSMQSCKSLMRKCWSTSFRTVNVTLNSSLLFLWSSTTNYTSPSSQNHVQTSFKTWFPCTLTSISPSGSPLPDWKIRKETLRKVSTMLRYLGMAFTLNKR